VSLQVVLEGHEHVVAPVAAQSKPLPPEFACPASVPPPVLAAGVLLDEQALASKKAVTDTSEPARRSVSIPASISKHPPVRRSVWI
jgi:hypothetical protein